MTFKDFVGKAWNEHTSDPRGWAERLPEGASLLRDESDWPSFAQLVLHLEGEHLGRWKHARALLESSLRGLQLSPESQGARRRFFAALELAENAKPPGEGGLEPSDRARVYALTAAMVGAQKRAPEALSYLREAERLVAELPSSDPAVRALAANANNLATGLTREKVRDTEETDLMLEAARCSRHQWERAGGWLEVERAEYGLALAFLSAGDTGRALMHARNGLVLCEQNAAPALELFFFQEAFARIHHADGDPDSARRALKLMRGHFDRLSADDREWCQATLDEVSAFVSK